MNLLVTGGAGYVGSHCVKHLLATGHTVTVFDNLLYGHRAAVTPPAHFVEGTLADPAAVRHLFQSQKIDAVLHFAALTYVGESVAKPLEYWQGNVTCTLNLLQAMADAGVARVVFSSTCAVYGNPDALPLVEDHAMRPISPYGATKLAVELIFQQCATAWNLGSIALRYFNACGASADGTLGEDHQPETHLIPLVIEAALGRRPAIRVFGADYPTPDGSCIRDYVHVDDLADAHERALHRIKPGAAEAFNLGTGKGASVLDVIASVERVSGSKVAVEFGPRREGDPPALYANPAKAADGLGWQARHIDLDEIVRSAFRWHESHPHGYGDRAY
jgi:UDP-glucose 4-epimerase